MCLLLLLTSNRGEVDDNPMRRLLELWTEVNGLLRRGPAKRLGFISSVHATICTCVSAKWSRSTRCARRPWSGGSSRRRPRPGSRPRARRRPRSAARRPRRGPPTCARRRSWRGPCRCDRRCRARPCSARSGARRTSCRAGATTGRRWRRRTCPARSRPPTGSASPGLTTTSIGAAGGVRVSQVAPPSLETWMSGDSALTRDDQLPGDLELVVVGLRALDALPRSRRGPWSGSARGSPAASPSCGWPEASRSLAPAKRTTRLPETVPPSSVPGEALGLLRARLQAEERRAGADHDRPVAGVDRDRVDRGAGAVAGRCRGAGGSVAVGASVGASRRERWSPRRRGRGRLLARRRRPRSASAPRSRTRARGAQAAQSNLARPAAISIAPSRWRKKRGSA